MAGKREANRQELKSRLVAAAREQILDKGLKGIRARDVTTRAGCALGGLYSVFEDLDMLVIAVNAETLMQLDAVLSSAAAGRPGPVAQMRAMARAYLRFALDNRNLWNAVFGHRLPEGANIPQWYVDEYVAMFRHVVAPLAMLEPELSPGKLNLKARSVFAAVHGIVAISIQERFVGVPGESLERELDDFIETLAAGIAARRGRTAQR